MLNPQELQLFDHALIACEVRPLAPDQAETLTEFLGIGPMIALCRQAVAKQKPGVDRLAHLSGVVRALTVARTKLRMPYATIERLDVAKTEDPPRFTTIFNDAITGDVNAVAVIKRWLAPAADPVPAPQAPPIHATTAAPPPASQPAPVAQNSQQQQTLRPREATPVGRAAASESHRDTRADRERDMRDASDHGNVRQNRNNVHELHAQDDRRHFPEQDRPAAVGTTQRNDPADRTFDQVEVYGRDNKGGTALQVENSPTRDRKSTTINLSLARAKGQKTQDGVDWNNKIMIMLVPHEVQLILAVLIGALPTARFAGHGQGNDKWIEVAETTDPSWAGQVTITLAQGKGPSADIRRCGISATDIGRVIAVFNRAQMSQLQGIAPVSGDRVAARVANLYSKAKAAQALRDESKNQAGGQCNRQRAVG